jgi:hypothetical protein
MNRKRPQKARLMVKFMLLPRLLLWLKRRRIGMKVEQTEYSEKLAVGP